MTELRHGSNVAALQTEAVLDPATDEWVITTPDDGAIKWWAICNLAYYRGKAALWLNCCGFIVPAIIQGWGCLPLVAPPAPQPVADAGCSERCLTCSRHQPTGQCPAVLKQALLWQVDRQCSRGWQDGLCLCAAPSASVRRQRCGG